MYNLIERINIHVPNTNKSYSEKSIPDIPELKRWGNYSRRMILTGMLYPDEKLNDVLKLLSTDKKNIILTETNSNLNGENFFPCVDKIINSISDKEAEVFRPQLLVTIGTNVISKMIKAFLRKHKPLEHWHIDIAGRDYDTYECLSSVIKADPFDFFSNINPSNISDDGYYDIWERRKKETEFKHDEYLLQTSFADISVFNTILKNIPDNSTLQMGNSTVVRYIQLFNQKKSVRYFCNRGTSGIDGCTSTASGAAYALKDQIVTLISGDISFLYDSNALWNKNLPSNLKIIVINNSGGGIFRFLKGSSDVEELEEFFETSHNVKFDMIAEAYGISYIFCNDQESLVSCLSDLYKSKSTTILEVKTPSIKSAEALKNYFNFIR